VAFSAAKVANLICCANASKLRIDLCPWRRFVYLLARPS
jgi:hypothetical protein